MQVAPALNDENSTATGFTHLKPSAPVQAAKQGSSLKSARKAFGNISNSQPLGCDASSSKQQQKDKPARRAFGDITNSSIKPPPGFASTAKAASTTSSSLFAALPTAKTAVAPGPAPAPDSSKVSTSGPETEQASSKPAWWEQLGPERPAGKTFEQQLQEEDAALDAEAQRAAAEVWQAVSRRGVFSSLVPPFPADSDDDDAIRLPPADTHMQEPRGSWTLPPLPDISADDLILPSDYDFASLLPAISDSTAGEDDDILPPPAATAAAAYTAADDAVQQLTDAVAAVSIDSAGPAQTSPVSAADNAQQLQDCRSPELLPW